jgi:hypothetical protein
MEGLYCQHDVLVYLVDEPSNDDQIINSMHHWIYSNIEEFNDEIEDYTNDTLEFLNVTEFISDFDDLSVITKGFRHKVEVPNKLSLHYG